MIWRRGSRAQREPTPDEREALRRARDLVDEAWRLPAKRGAAARADDAVAAFRRLLKVVGIPHAGSGLAAALERQATLLEMAGDARVAAKRYEEAIDLAGKVLNGVPENDPRFDGLVADLARLLARRAEALRGLRPPDEVKSLLQEAFRCAERSSGRLALEAKADAALAMVRTDVEWLERGPGGRADGQVDPQVMLRLGGVMLMPEVVGWFRTLAADGAPMARLKLASALFVHGRGLALMARRAEAITVLSEADTTLGALNAPGAEPIVAAVRTLRRELQRGQGGR